MNTQWFPGQTYTNLDPLSTNYFTGGQMGYMPNAQYLIDPMYGAFRTPMAMPQYPTNYSYPGLFQSLMTSWRGDDTNKYLRYIGETFAHSPMGANQLQYQAEATRRIQDAKSSFGGAALDVGVQALFAAGGTAIGGPIGGIIGGMLAPSIGGMMSERQRTARQLQLLTSPLITSGKDVNKATGQGLSLPAAGDLTSFLNKEAAGDYFFKLDDYKKFTSLAAKTGMFDYANSVEQFKGTIKKVRKDMMTLMDIFETADPEDVFKQLQRLQVSGAGQSESLGVASKERMYSTMLGMGHQQMISSYGQSGALMYNRMGRTGYLGELANVANAANVTMAKRLGLISESEVNRLGGVGGAADRYTHEIQGKAFGDLMEYVGAYVWDGDSKGTANQEKLDKIRSGNFDFDAIQKSMQGMSRDPRKLLQYNAVKDLLQHNIEAGMGEDGVKEAVYNMAIKFANRTNLRHEDDQFKALNGMQMMGVSAPLARQVMEQMGSSDMRSAFRENQEKEYEKRLASINKKYEEQEHWWAKMTVKLKQAFNTFEEMSLTGMSIRAKWVEEQRKENKDLGKDTPLVFNNQGAGFTKNTPKGDKDAGADRVLRKSNIAPAPVDDRTYEATPGSTEGLFGDWGYGGTNKEVPAPHVQQDFTKPEWKNERYQRVPRTRQAQKYPSNFKVMGSDVAYDGRFDEYVNEAAQKFNVDPKMLIAIMRQESKFNPSAVNDVSGASGLMQIMPSNFKGLKNNYGIDITEKNKLDPKTNIMAGAAIWAEALRAANGNVERALGYYNNGFKGLDWENGKKETREYVPQVMGNYRQLQQIAQEVPQKAKDYAQSDGATDKAGTTDWYAWSHKWRFWTPDIVTQMKDFTEHQDYSKIYNATNADVADRVKGRDEFNEEIQKHGLDSEDVLKTIGNTDDIENFSGDKYRKHLISSFERAHRNKYGMAANAKQLKAYGESVDRLSGSESVKGHILSHALPNNNDLRKSYVSWGNRVKKAYYSFRNDKIEEGRRETDKMMKDIAPGVYGATGDDLNTLVNNNVELLKAYQMFTVGAKMKSDVEYGIDPGESASALHSLGGQYYSDFKFEEDGSMDVDKFKAYLKNKKGYSEEHIDAIAKMAQAKKETLKAPGDIGKFTKKTGEVYNRKVDEYYEPAMMGLEDLMQSSGITPDMLNNKDAMAAHIKKNPNNELAKEVYRSMQNGKFDMPKFLSDNREKLENFTKHMASKDEVAPEAQKHRIAETNKQQKELVEMLRKLNNTLDSMNKQKQIEERSRSERTSKGVGQSVTTNVATSNRGLKPH